MEDDNCNKKADDGGEKKLFKSINKLIIIACATNRYFFPFLYSCH